MSWENYDDVLDQLREAGLLVEHLEVGSHRPVRVRVEGDREKRGWYWLSEIELETKDGGRRRFIVGSYGIWYGNDNGARKVRLAVKGKKRATLTQDQKAAIAARHRENAKRAKALRAAEAERAAAVAAKAWRAYLPDGESPYLVRKHVGAHGVRFSPSGNGTLAVPMCDAAGRIWGLQIIRGERRPGQLEKEYWPKGLAKQGHYHLIGAPVPGGVALVAEGYATAATLHEATGLPVAVAFDASNLRPVAEALRGAHRNLHLLICADDDYLQKCRACGRRTPVAEPACVHCGEPHGKTNPGVEAAKAAALAVGGAVCVPQFPFDREGKKLTDFNDLANAPAGGPQLVQAQVVAAIEAAGWQVPPAGAVAQPMPQSDGEKRPGAQSIMTLDDAVERFVPIDDGNGKTLFDTWARRMATREQMLTLLPAGVRWDDVKRHPRWIARGAFFIDEVGFDPAGTDPKVKLNLWAGWPMQPKKGSCVNLLGLLDYLCSGEPNGQALYEWVLKWLAYPLQHPGAKMLSALVVHGPQGTGKSMFFEYYARIFGPYGLILDQDAIEDRFNADWASGKLFVIADEVVARSEMYHVKNKLKGLITRETIRINPKNLAAHEERNHINLVFLSNEKQPVVLEGDDRRHCVIWVPGKLDKAYYRAVAEEAANGGVEALYHYLMSLDLGDFEPWTEPPVTHAKAELIDLGLSSEEVFVKEWQAGEVELNDEAVPFCPCVGSDLYRVYTRWCQARGELRPRPMRVFIAHLGKLPGWQAAAARKTYDNLTPETLDGPPTRSRKMVIPPEDAIVDAARARGIGFGQAMDFTRRADESQAAWLTRGLIAMQNAIEVAIT